MTISAWVYSNGVGDTWGCIAGTGASVNADWSLRLTDNGKFGVTLRDNGAQNQTGLIESENRIDDSNWHLVTSVYDNTLGKSVMYIDGLLDNEAIINLNSGFNQQRNIFSGANNDHSGTMKYFLGTIDEVRIWNKALTQAEIQATMFTHLSGNEEGLVGYWTFNEEEGSPWAYDVSGFFLARN